MVRHLGDVVPTAGQLGAGDRLPGDDTSGASVAVNNGELGEVGFDHVEIGEAEVTVHGDGGHIAGEGQSSDPPAEVLFGGRLPR